MQIQFFGAAGSVTGSCFAVEAGRTRFLVDCGMFQGSKALRERNYGDFAFRARDVDFVLLTHAHIDHSGLIPKLVKHGFRGKVYTTPATAALCKWLLPDSGRIQETECEQKNRRQSRRGSSTVTPIYTEEDALRAVERFIPVRLHDPRDLAPNVRVRFGNAGHILGSAFIEVWVTEGTETRKIVFSGDVGAKDHPIIQDPEYVQETDFLVVESTYGDRNREDEPNEARRGKLGEIVQEICGRGGNLIIPGFAVGRTQDLLHDLQILRAEKAIPRATVYVDSPLACNVSQVFASFPEEYDEEATRLLANRRDLFAADWIRFVSSLEESRSLNTARGAIIISASGMCDAGRIKHHLRHHLYKPDDGVLIVGYQAEGTLGRFMLDGSERVRIHGCDVAVKARICQIPGYSGHADQDGLVSWVSHMESVRGLTFIVHGEDTARAALAERLGKERGLRTHVPAWGEAVDLESLAVQAPATPAPVAGPDSHNAYASFMLEMAAWMQREGDESKRASKIAALRALLA